MDVCRTLVDKGVRSVRLRCCVIAVFRTLTDKGVRSVGLRSKARSRSSLIRLIHVELHGAGCATHLA